MTAEAKLAHTKLDDKYTLEEGRIFITGSQALVRLPLMQKWLDKKNGLNTAGFVSGYRGSPLARLDQQLWAAGDDLKKNDITFTPGINEDLGLTAVWGSQQTGLFPGAKFEGVFGLWYGKGPGVDRSMDALKHANGAGTDPKGGVVALMGDDHGCVSSTLGHQSDQNMMAAHVPVLYPATVQEYLDFGLAGFALSRYAGCWVGLKCVTETVESSASVDTSLQKIKFNTPTDYTPPEGGLSIRVPDAPLAQEARLSHKIEAALAWARANKLDKKVMDSPKAKLGIISAGKSYKDVLQALDDLGIDGAKAKELGLRIYKVGMVWPLEPHGAKAFADGLDEVLVVEEKRDFLEGQLKEILYSLPDSRRPVITGKFDDKGKPLLRAFADHTPAMVAQAIANRIAAHGKDKHITDKAAYMTAREAQARAAEQTITRLPYYCAGCPHNTSTQVPDGSRAIAGIGCHYMVQWMDRNSNIITHMGAEGVNWVGHAPFTAEKHVFANLGDGTYYHSGILAIRAAISAGVNITYKILYNDAVAMTGGQPVEGGLTVAQVAQQMLAEGVKRAIVVSDEPEKYKHGEIPHGVDIFHRDQLPQLQKELRETAGCTVMIYDQTCAAEKRRRRKRGTFPDPDKRVFINEDVCEGCGDCSVKSNCVAVEPKETEFGRKRAINQSVCNKDYSCVKGFCPSFITVHGGKLKKLSAGTSAHSSLFSNLPEPVLKKMDGPYNILVTGIGGTGVITIGAIIGMAAHLEGKGVTVLDQTGLAQKNGAVMTHLRLGKKPDDLHTVRIATASTDLLLGCDMVVSASTESLARLDAKRTHAVINSHMAPTAGFTLNPDTQFHEDELYKTLKEATGGHTDFLAATNLATALLGDSIATNMFMLGYAWQKGLVPVSMLALERAIELNEVAVEANKRAIAWGRLAATDLAQVSGIATPTLQPDEAADISTSLNELVEKRTAQLKVYGNRAGARRYARLVEKVRNHEQTITPGNETLAEAVARYTYKLMAVKDEWEVARLYADPAFKRRLGEQFTHYKHLTFHLAPPLFAKRDKATGHLQKMEFGPWVLSAFGLMAKMRFLRGTPLDIFRYTAERKMERTLLADYLALVDELLQNLTQDNHELAVALARIPEEVRGFGHVKERHLKTARSKWNTLLEAFRHGDNGKITGTDTLPGLHLSHVQAHKAARTRIMIEHGA